jgi:hypothetical protein
MGVAGSVLVFWVMLAAALLVCGDCTQCNLVEAGVGLGLTDTQPHSF